MQLNLLMIGNTQKGFVYDGIEEYLQRLKHYVKFEQKILQSPKNIKNQSIQIQQKKESDLLAENINDKSIVVLLDEIGKEYTSEQFSNWLNKSMNTGQDITFVIGGAYGFSDELKSKYPKIALSKMTFSHQMIRLFFIEQLYRAFTILKGENYHH